ncbi:putative glycolipid-binding domain-containing protein [Hydrogenophaga sp.]|uniref:putative glycolipid-binding domain-containing protein n=1 Tax=Hydrogenophaga sp. TaxID=1904254 RepID=UPI00272EEABF|nr:putative glycolipid-binding domain-containing protein [Hydrogenophaga sp.]MDP2018911.1 putative glycolipid-binding domain-containing protein [Hydrogenophaga sp.]MDP3164108.1 putative glycolipid-binding domain-containing protein [Hydrogenophaga sp.]MDP3811418.1 putative glycolipid-binding domain-containing protein [Hydrogenophaga sp.]
MTPHKTTDADTSPNRSVLFWRRTDIPGLERLELKTGPDGVTASSTVICLEQGGFRLEHRWTLTADWCVQSADIERWNDQGHERLRLQRVATGWEVNGLKRPDLDGAEEPDLSVTPFCNSFAIRRVPAAAGQHLTLDTVFIDGVALTVARSRQRYERQGPGRLRYVDLGLFSGFQAALTVDENGLVTRYQGLFERVESATWEESGEE